MKVLAKSRKAIVALGMAIALVAVGYVAALPKSAEALTAGQIASSQPISYVLGQPWAPSWHNCYSTAKGCAVLKTKYDQDCDMHEFQAALDPSFTKGVKWLTSTLDNVSSRGLVPGKTYYIRFRNYGDTINGSSYVGGYLCGPWVSNWSTTKAVKVCYSPKKKNKLVGKWKLVKSSYNNAMVKYNNRHGGKFILTLKKNGKGLMKDFGRNRYKVTSWGITGKKKGNLSVSSLVMGGSAAEYGTAKVSGKKLVLKMKTNSGKTYSMTFKRK